MKKIVLLSCLLIQISGFSQTGYPKKIILQGDTVVALTQKQIIDINIMYLSLDECRAIDAKNNEIIDGKTQEILLLELDIADYKNIISTKDSIQVEQNKQYQILATKNEAQEKQIKKLQITRKVFTFVGTSVGAVLGYVAGKYLIK